MCIRDRHATTVDKVVEIAGERSCVVYCSVGIRSAKLVRLLSQAGVKNACNLTGSIFRWTNEGRQVFRGNQSVETVHPFDSKWGQLLNRDHHGYL